MALSDLESLKAVLPILSLLTRSLVRAAGAVHRFLGRVADVIPPISDGQASVIAYTHLAGRIHHAFAYRNLDDRILVVALRSDDENEAFRRIHVLEEFGRTYREIWRSDRIVPPRDILAADIDGDGYKEVVFVQEEFGTGGGLRELHIYSTTRQQLFTLSESYDWQSPGGPVAPTITTSLGAEENFVRAVERYAVRHDFLKKVKTDLDNPQYAATRWHALNGTKDRGRIRLHQYSGKPAFRSSVVVQLDTGNVVWTAYFKSALCGYIKSQNRHFVAYSPSWTYSWVRCLAHDGERLWFGGGKPGLWAFGYDGSEGVLEYYTFANGVELPVIGTIEVRLGALRLNQTIDVRFDALS